MSFGSMPGGQPQLMKSVTGIDSRKRLILSITSSAEPTNQDWLIGSGSPDVGCVAGCPAAIQGR